MHYWATYSVFFLNVQIRLNLTILSLRHYILLGYILYVGDKCIMAVHFFPVVILYKSTPRVSYCCENVCVTFFACLAVSCVSSHYFSYLLSGIPLSRQEHWQESLYYRIMVLDLGFKTSKTSATIRYVNAALVVCFTANPESLKCCSNPRGGRVMRQSADDVLSDPF